MWGYQHAHMGSLIAGAGIPYASSDSQKHCLLQEFDSLEEASVPTKAAELHGVLCNISPMKKGKYYEGVFWPILAPPRVVSFHAKRDQLTQFDKNSGKCSIKKSIC